MDPEKGTAPLGGGIVQLWRADNSNYSELAEAEQRFWRCFQETIASHDRRPSRQSLIDVLQAQRTWQNAYTRWLEVSCGARA